MVILDLDDYDKRAKEAQALYNITSSFDEPSRVPISISTGPHYYCHLFNVSLRDYFTDLDCYLDVQLRAIKWTFEVLQDDRVGYAVAHSIDCVMEGLFFDCEVAYPNNATPWIVPRLKTPGDIEAPKVPEPATHPKVQEFYSNVEKLRSKVEKMGLNIPATGCFRIHPPLSAACAIMGAERFYTLMGTQPDMAKLLLTKMHQAFRKLEDHHMKVTGAKTTRLSLADDNSAFISNKMYRELVYDHNLALYKRYGSEYRYLHADGPNHHHFRMYACEFGLARMDAGGFSDLEIAKRELGGACISAISFRPNQSCAVRCGSAPRVAGTSSP